MSEVRGRAADASEKGTVKWYSLAKGYGFITPEAGGDDVFVHHSAFDEQESGQLEEGENVLFERHSSPRGPLARRLHRLDLGQDGNATVSTDSPGWPDDPEPPGDPAQLSQRTDRQPRRDS